MTESPNHPQPDEIPDNERTGDEPNPSGRPGQPKENVPRERGVEALTPLLDA